MDNIKQIKICPIIAGHSYVYEVGDEFNGHSITQVLYDDTTNTYSMWHNDVHLGCILLKGNNIIKTLKNV